MTAIIPGPEGNLESDYASLSEGFFARVAPTPVAAPRLLRWNEALGDELGFSAAWAEGATGLGTLAGNRRLADVEPIAMAYAGHQFGNWNPSLGDGRAIQIGEVSDPTGARRGIQLKGAGPTPFSRRGDGRAAIGPVLREYVLSEAMHAMGIPTTRALAMVTTGESVYRERAEPGAILTRVARGFVRVGTFEYFAAHGDTDAVRSLADYVIAHRYPEAASEENPYLALLNEVVSSQADLIGRWMLIGFIHGVMNTDNTTISGETIDYGPCAFMDAYDPATVFSSIDLQGRYAYANQASILTWNLARLAETLIELVDLDKDRALELLTDGVNEVPSLFADAWLARMRAKIGLHTAEDGDVNLVNRLLDAMHQATADFTLTFRRLSDAVRGNSAPVRLLFKDSAEFDAWESDWRARLDREQISAGDRACVMDQVNPIYIPRNHKVEEALAAAVDQGNMSAFDDMLSVVSTPFDEISGREGFAELGPKTAVPYQTFCGT